MAPPPGLSLMPPAWWQRLVGATGATRTPGAVRPGPRTRTEGLPTSSNRASSFHLGWGATAAATGASVTLEILEPPVVARLYFWALQADMGSGGRRVGGAHLGLQWHPGHPGSTAVNWGGYRASGQELHGSDSALRSATGNPNTRDCSWSAGRPYRLSIERVAADDGPRVPAGLTAWRGSVQDLHTGERRVVRDLYMDGDSIIGVTMWSEVFARCDDPTVSIRWSRPVVHLPDRDVEIDGVVVNYQAVTDGGCTNTDSTVDEVGVVQRTAVGRSTPQGTRLALPELPAP